MGILLSPKVYHPLPLAPPAFLVCHRLTIFLGELGDGSI
jgi:hypothetical protein